MGRTEFGVGVGPLMGDAVLQLGGQAARGMGVTHHSDVEDVKQVKRQSGNQIDEEPCGQVVEANGTRS